MVFGILAYLWVLVLIPLLVKRDDEFVHFHTKQGIILLIIWIADWVIALIPFVGWLISSLGFVVLGIICLIAIVKVLMGEKWEIPIISTYADKLNM